MLLTVLTRCDGERVITERATLDLQIPKGAPEQHTLHFPGIGSHLVGREAGDIEVRHCGHEPMRMPKPVTSYGLCRSSGGGMVQVGPISENRVVTAHASTACTSTSAALVPLTAGRRHRRREHAGRAAESTSRTVHARRGQP